MKAFRSSIFLTVFCLAVASTHAVITVCSKLENITCVNAGNRICLKTDGKIGCGYCLDGYLEYKGDCYLIDDINFTLVNELIIEHYPQLTTDTPMEIRLQRLKLLARIISRLRSAIPPLDFKLDLNRFSLDTREEQQQRLGYRYSAVNASLFPRFNFSSDAATNNSSSRRLQPDFENLPDEVDWEVEGAMTEVKDQGRCGCCWAVATMAAVEAAVYLTPASAGFKQSLSFQQLISCDEDNFGCNGGNILLAMKYAWKNNGGGVATLNDYPYTDKDGSTTEDCNPVAQNATVGLRDPKIVALINDNMNREARILRFKQAVSIQPVVMVLRSGCDLFSSYSGGVLTQDGSCACQQASCIDHAVVLVGYNDTADVKYWKLRNSWSTRWGEDGYFRIAQEGGGRWGLFGMLAEGAIPLDAYNFTGAVRDLELDEDEPTLEGYQIVLIAVAGMLILCCLGGILLKACSRKETTSA